MLLTKANKCFCTKRVSLLLKIRASSSAVTASDNKYTDFVDYPPIQDISPLGNFKRYHENWHNQVKELKTVEEKMIKINMPRFWGFKCMMYEEDKIFYNELPHAQYITLTHVMKEPKLPSCYDNLVSSEKLDSLTQEIKGSIEESIIFEVDYRKRRQELTKDVLDAPREMEDIICSAVAKSVNRIMLGNLADYYKHLNEIEIDYEPRIEAGWFAGGIELHEHIIRGRKQRFWHAMLNEPADRPFQYIGKPSLHLRHNHPLKEIIPLSECENSDFDVPQYKFDPRTIGHALKRRHMTNIPGFWPGAKNEFGFLSYHKRGYMIDRTFNDDSDALKAQAIFANYGWLLAQACNLGFSTFNDVTYPLVNQAVITNGKWWSFCVYQLNTTLVNTWHHDTNPKRNLCWMPEPMKLYESIEGDKLIGFNDEVIKNLIKFYANKPEERVGVNMKPYLGDDVKVIADIGNDEKRKWLEDRFKMLVSNRPRKLLVPELYHWEVIYKHQFKTMPMEKRRTPWDFGVNPMLRRLDQHIPHYIPKDKRKPGAFKKKWEDTYYP